MKSIISETEKKGCEISSQFFKCLKCPLSVGGFYDKQLGIVICENHFQGTKRTEEILLHEAVHAFDYCRMDLDPDDCVQTACTEIRASNLSGQCSWSNEISRGNLKVRKQYQNCIRRRAALSLENLPHCKGNSKNAVNRAWKSCYPDDEPFGFIP
uniref:Mitochondrial inner membrane protease ATP23 n=1 Tax=Arcella intermedia TaxID=1963864 RepID=A0A6B2LNE3_9EUKA